MRQINLLQTELQPHDKSRSAALTASVGPAPAHKPIWEPLPPDHPLTLTNNLIDVSHAQEAVAPPKRPSGIYGSSWWKCQRQQLYNLLGFAPEPAIYVWEWDMAARLGDAVHNEVQKDLIKRGLVAYLDNFTNNADRRIKYRKRGKRQAAIEVPLDQRVVPAAVADELKALKLRIRIDAIIQRPPKPETIVEIKTVSDKYFTDFAKLSKYKLPGYDPQIQMQMHFYRDSQTGRRPPIALCYIVNRQDITKRLEIPIYYDPAYAPWGVRRIQSIRAAWAARTLLPAEPGNDCKFCDHLHKCPAKGRDADLEKAAAPMMDSSDATRYIYR